MSTERIPPQRPPAELRFAQPTPPPPADPPLPPVDPTPAQQASQQPSPPQPAPSPLERLRQTLSPSTPSGGRPMPTGPSESAAASSAATPTSTERRQPGGDPTEVGKTIAGLLAIVTGWMIVRAARRNRHFRAPTPAQRDEIAMPLGRILVRHLPMDLLGPDITDATASAAATQNYLMAGPLLTPIPAPENPLEN